MSINFICLWGRGILANLVGDKTTKTPDRPTFQLHSYTPEYCTADVTIPLLMRQVGPPA